MVGNKKGILYCICDMADDEEYCSSRCLKGKAISPNIVGYRESWKHNVENFKHEKAKARGVRDQET